MTPIEYNQEQIDSGAFSPAMIARLVQAWQSANSLEIDGKCGPATQASIQASIEGSLPLPLPPAPLYVATVTAQDTGESATVLLRVQEA